MVYQEQPTANLNCVWGQAAITTSILGAMTSRVKMAKQEQASSQVGEKAEVAI